MHSDKDFDWSRTPIVILVGTLASLLAIITFITGKGSLPELLDSRATPTVLGIPPAPPNVDAPILTIESLWDSSDCVPGAMICGCYPEGNTHVVTLIQWGQDDLWIGASDPFFYIADENGIKLEYYIHQDIAQVTKSWIPVIMVPGRRLKIEYLYCGNHPYRYLTYIEVL